MFFNFQHESPLQQLQWSRGTFGKFSTFLNSGPFGHLDSRVVFTLDYNEHRYAVPWAERLILGDDYSFSAQA